MALPYSLKNSYTFIDFEDWKMTMGYRLLSIGGLNSFFFSHPSSNKGWKEKIHTLSDLYSLWD